MYGDIVILIKVIELHHQNRTFNNFRKFLYKPNKLNNRKKKDFLTII